MTTYVAVSAPLTLPYGLLNRSAYVSVSGRRSGFGAFEPSKSLTKSRVTFNQRKEVQTRLHCPMRSIALPGGTSDKPPKAAAVE